MEYFPDSRTLDQHIPMLRKKIGEDCPLIETVRGIGYRFRGKAQEPGLQSGWSFPKGARA